MLLGYCRGVQINLQLQGTPFAFEFTTAPNWGTLLSIPEQQPGSPKSWGPKCGPQIVALILQGQPPKKVKSPQFAETAMSILMFISTSTSSYIYIYIYIHIIYIYIYIHLYLHLHLQLYLQLYPYCYRP